MEQQPNERGITTGPSGQPLDDGRPPEFRLPVKVSALVICQDAFRDDRGRTHLHGVFDNLHVSAFPVSVPITVWCKLRGRGTARLVLKIVDSLESNLVVTEPFITEVTPFKAHEFFLTFTLTLAGAGLYRITAYVDGIPAMETPLMVRHSPAAAPNPTT